MSPPGVGVLGRWRDWLTELWPGRCVACRGPADSSDLCQGCRTDLRSNDCCCPRCAMPLAEAAIACGRCLRRAPAFDGAWAPWRYQAPLDLLVMRLKFGGDLAAARVLAALWLEALPVDAHPSVDVLVPVPLARARLRERGFNQALELARPLAQQLQLPLRAQVLQRARATDPQSGLNAKARRRNVAGAFQASAAVKGLRVAVIDDVMTTGATMHACARALRRAGACEVQAWALARAG